MPTYNFNIQEMLNAYGGDAEMLQQAFHEALDAELYAEKPDVDANINIAATDVAGLWGEYIRYYLEQKDMIDLVDHEKLEITPEQVIQLTEYLIKILPLI